MSPSPICSHKTFRAKSTNRAIRTTAGLMMLPFSRQRANWSRIRELWTARATRCLARDFQPQSHISQTLKDVELILKEAERHDLQLPITLTQAGLQRTAIALAGPNSDSSAVIKAIRRRPNSTEDIR